MFEISDSMKELAYSAPHYSYDSLMLITYHDSIKHCQIVPAAC